MNPRETVAYRQGRAASESHYQQVASGHIPEHPLPGNPYPRPKLNQGWKTSWHNWNLGWNEGVPEIGGAR